MYSSVAMSSRFFLTIMRSIFATKSKKKNIISVIPISKQNQESTGGILC